MTLALFGFLVMIAGYAGGALAAVFARSLRGARSGTSMGAAIGSVGSLWAAVSVMASGRAVEWLLPSLVAPAGGLVVRLDPLGAFFLAIVGLGGLPAAMYGESYTEAYEARWPLRFVGAAFNVFLLGMSLVPCAGNIFTFVMAWELMSLASYCLVVIDAGDAETRLAGQWYIAMTQFSLVTVLPALLLLAPGADHTTFADLRVGAAAAGPSVRAAVFALALVGFGSKAGLVPLHVWLPRAHPAAPSHVSALMSGVMIKLGIYGLIRVMFDLMGGGPPWWGAVLLLAGSFSALLGVLYALMEHDLKRLLAYHSVENIGIIVIGLGAGAMLQSYGLHALALVGVAAALYHSLNHACFKGLLFLAGGSAVHEAGTRNMEEMGGLVTRMPQTAVLFFVGAAAIAALPPLNGFASEWLVFQTLLAGTNIPRPEIAIGFPVAIGMLALASGLAAACFVKAFGISFLAMPRSTHAANAHEAPASMRAAGWLLAGMCVLLGIGAPLVIPALYRVLSSIDALAAPGSPVPASAWWIGAGTTLGWLSPPLLAVAMAVIVIVTLFAVRAISRLPIRRADTWGCGRIAQTPRMEYTASAFAEPLRRVFAELYRPTQDLSVIVHPESKYFVDSITFRSEVRPWFEQAIYEPVIRAVRAVGSTVRKMQAGSVHLYLVYVVVALVMALAAVWWQP